MENCRLCRAKVADKKGSHIIPHFLLKRIENVDGKTGRDYGLGFIIQKNGVQSHFERSVSPDTLNEVYGELSDEDIAENIHPYIVDFFFCKECEDKFAKIESTYATTLNIKDVQQYDSGIPSELGILFWASVIWRVSINGKAGIKLTKNQEEVLRRILNRSLKTDIADINLQEIRESKDLNKISYRLLRCPDYSVDNATHFIFDVKTKHPYTLLIDEFILLFSFNGNYNDYLNTDFFGLKDEVLAAPINTSNSNELIYVMNDSVLNNISVEMSKKIADNILKTLDKVLDKTFSQHVGPVSVMPAHIKSEIIHEVVSDEKKLGRKFTAVEIVESATKVMKKHYRFE